MRLAKSTEPRKQKKKAQSLQWQFEKKLPSGKVVNVQITQGMEVIERRVKVEVGVRLIGDYPITQYSNMRDKDGNLVTAPMKVPGLKVVITFKDGESYTARSCCKPPDVFCARTARRKAMRRIFMLDDGINPASIRYHEVKLRRKGVTTVQLRPIADKNFKKRLVGKDRKSIFYAVLRNGKERHSEINKVE
jgi:hypothetical protein